jgi:tetratricopeptide (TPR) repeat protein
LALWLIAHFGLVSIHNNAGELKIEDVILKIILPYLGVVTGVDLAMTLLGIFKDSTQTLFELLRMLVRRKPQAADSISSEFPYEVIAPEALPSRLPDLSHPDVPYVRRQPDGPYQEMIESMKGTQHLLILGRRGLGKTREAIELILRLQAESGEEVTVLLPQGPLDVPTSLPREQLKRHVVLFLDNLHELYGIPGRLDSIKDAALIQRSFRERFYDSVRVFQDCLGTKFHVIATAIGLPEWRAKLRLNDDFWRSFKVYQLPDLSPEKRPELLGVIERHLKISITENAKEQMVLRSDGTFSSLILPLWRDRHKRSITALETKDYKFVYPADWENSVYRDVFMPDRHRVALLKSLSVLQQTNMARHVNLVVPLAARMASQNLQLLHRLLIKRAMLQITDWVSVSAAGIVKCNDAFLVGKADIENEKEALLDIIYNLLRTRRNVEFLRPSVHELINYLLDHDDSFSAIKLYRWLLDANPDNARARNQLANLYFKLGQIEEAERECLLSIKQCGHPESWVTLASIRYTQRQFREAESACQTAIEKNRNCWFYWARLASIQGELRQYTDAVRSAKNAVHLRKQLPLAHMCLAIAHEQAGQFDRAIRQGWYAIALDPDNGAAWQTLGVSYSRAGLYDQAMQACTRATELSPASSAAWALLARTMETAGRHGSLELFAKACELSPQDATLKLSYAIALGNLCTCLQPASYLNRL